jgi:DNA polymerase III delta prime subunit
METEDFDILMQRGRVPHALLLVGGSVEEACRYAAKLLGLPSVNNHPDVHLYRPEGRVHHHPIESMRQLIDEVIMPPFQACAKVFIIEEADRMLPVSSNALLKTLEEPPAQTYFFLLCQSVEALLPTIVSRCQKLVIGEGSARAQDMRIIDILTTSDYSERLRLLADLDESLDEDEETRTRAIDTLFEQIAAWIRDHHILAAGANKKLLTYPDQIKSRSLPDLPHALKLLAECRFAVQQNMRLRVALDHLCLSLNV